MPNQKWCTDFTYLFLKDGEAFYNRTIIDLHNRSVVVSITARHITSVPAVPTLKKTPDSQHISKGGSISPNRITLSFKIGKNSSSMRFSFSCPAPFFYTALHKIAQYCNNFSISYTMLYYTNKIV